ncbi:hypothetical protein, conserved [Babesia ovata]|uniref:Extracellular matrix-binding ebh n=1 Tax=Babesia ovata TaxID=189622 RepID=A0A2H6KJK1_9APIC|nr:uncharacterized protein BOVATA_046680 [Babesia ovata]GBE63175.1 hypothetical protein, conserved [Babesia ovata]
MAFLHGVLKDVHAKQPYSVGKQQLNGVIGELFSKLCSGHKGFKSVITEVAAGVGEYNALVRESNERMKGVITGLYNHVKNGSEFDNEMFKINANSVTAETDDDQVNKAKGLVDGCIGASRTFLGGIQSTRNDVDRLNYDLKLKVESAIDNVQYAYDTLSKLSGKEKKDLDETLNLVKTRLTKFRDDVKKRIRGDVTTLVKDLQELIKKIKTMLENINKCLTEYIEKLQKWIQAAGEVRRLADGKVTEIVRKLQGEDKSDKAGDKGGVTDAAQKLQRKADDLHQAAFKAKEAVKRLVSLALTEVKTMDDALRASLRTVRDEIKAQMNNYLKGGFAELVRKKVEELVNPIHEVEGRDLKEDLGTIVSKIGEYSKDFKQRFQGAIEKMVTGLLGTKIIDMYLGTPLKNTKDAAIRTISSQISKIDAKPIINSKSNDVNEIFTSIQRYLEAYASAVDPTKNFKAISQKILSEPEVKALSLPDDDINFTFALKTILTAVMKAAEGAAGELQNFIDTSQIGNLKAAITKAQGLGIDVQRQLGESGQPVAGSGSTGSKNLYNTFSGYADTMLQRQIGVNDTKNIPAASSHAEKVALVEHKFKGYLESVNTSQVVSPDGQLTGASGEGSLPQAIKKIETQVKEALKTIESLNGEAETQLQTTYRHLDSLCQAITEFAETGHDSAKKNITELKRKIGITLKGEQTSFQKVHYNLNQLREDNLKKAINDAENFSVEADKEKKKTIRKLNAFVTFTIDSVRDNITNDLKSRYVKFIKSQLTKFAEKVEKEIGTLPKDITKDADKGFKGFMGVLEQKLTDSKIQELGENAKLGDLSPKVQKFFTDLPKR